MTMKSYLLILNLYLVLFCCDSLEMNNDQEYSQYSELIASVNDSSQFVQLDSASTNPILSSLQEKYDWQVEKGKVERNPFLPGQVEVKVKRVVKPVPRPLNETKGLNLTGIIKVGNTRKALVNGNLYQQGDRIRNLVITSIQKNRITLKSRLKFYTLHLNEN